MWPLVKVRKRGLQLKPYISTTLRFTANLPRSQGAYGYCSILLSANKNSGSFFYVQKTINEASGREELSLSLALQSANKCNMAHF